MRFRIAHYDRPALLVERDGGRGEASPLLGYSPDTLEECAAELWADEPRSPAARCAVETARREAAALARGAPLFGGAREVPLAALVRDVAEGRAALARGVRTLKAKDLALATALRRELGGGFALRLDANGRAVDLRAAAALGLEYVEEPAGLLTMARAPVPLAADETLQRVGLSGLPPAVRVVVLKPMALGLERAIALADEARARGLDVVVTHMFEGPIGVAAACELALAVGGARAHGLDRWRGVVPQVGDATVRPSGRPGLGLP